MEIFTGQDIRLKNSSVTLGKFDGIHLGHRSLLARVLEQEQCVSTVFTFSGGADGNRLYTQAEKDRILEGLGIEREILFPFHEGTRNMSPETFIREVLVGKLDVRYICVGEDFRFGKDRAGSTDTLRAYQSAYGYGLEILPKLRHQGEVISSTRVRQCLDRGDMEQVNTLLGQPYFLMGEVSHGRALGRTLQMPTANLVPPEGKRLPPLGVYATVVNLEGREYLGVTNLGRKPTVGEFSIGVETFLMDFDQDIYGSEITVSFHRFLRSEKKFSGVEALVAQINRDKVAAMDFFKSEQFMRKWRTE